MVSRLRRLLDRVASLPALLAWLALIFGLSSIPNTNRAESSSIPADKVAHALEFGVLAAIACWLLARRRLPLSFAVVLAIALSTAYGASDEFHQRFVAGRDPSLDDLAADAIGATLGALLAAQLWRRGNSRERPRT